MTDTRENKSTATDQEKIDESKLTKWEPVSNLHDPYEYADEKVREYHRNYVKFWLSGNKGGR